MDPPYYGCEDYYGNDIFNRADFTSLAAILRGIKGKFILSINDIPEIRDLFAGFNIETVKTNYSLRKGENKKTTELLISNT